MANISVYAKEGEIKWGKPDGTGRMTYAVGEYKDGTWADGAFVGGQVKLLYADGSVYEGEWVDGTYNGNGKRTLADTSVFEGEWKNGKFVK